MDVQVFQATDSPDKPSRGKWALRMHGHNRAVHVACVVCAHVFQVDAWAVMLDGTVAHVMECPTDEGGCGWYGHGRLSRWTDAS